LRPCAFAFNESLVEDLASRSTIAKYEGNLAHAVKRGIDIDDTGDGLHRTVT
jgi:hypothetical protein